MAKYVFGWLWNTIVESLLPPVNRRQKCFDEIKWSNNLGFWQFMSNSKNVVSNWGLLTYLTKYNYNVAKNEKNFD